MNVYENIMGNGGPICRLIGSGDCDNCKAKKLKLKLLPYNGINKKIYRCIKRC